MRLAIALIALAALIGACHGPRTHTYYDDGSHVGPGPQGEYHDYFDYYNGRKHGDGGVHRHAY